MKFLSAEEPLSTCFDFKSHRDEYILATVEMQHQNIIEFVLATVEGVRRPLVHVHLDAHVALVSRHDQSLTRLSCQPGLGVPGLVRLGDELKLCRNLEIRDLVRE